VPAEIEIHIPISPTPTFLRQVHYLAASLRRNGGVLSESSIVVTAGEDCEPYDLVRAEPWASAYPIRFEWVPRALFQKYGYFATGAQRYHYPFRARYVLMLDADLVVAGGFEELLDRANAAPALYGMIAHASPWQNTGLLNVRGDAEWWRLLFETAGLGEPPMDCQYSGYGILGKESFPRQCPPYFNLGVVLAPSAMFQALGGIMRNELDFVDRIVETPYRAQIALTLALLRLRLPWRTLPLRYNFTPGFSAYFEALPEEWTNARVLHYTCTPQFDKDQLMNSYAKMSEWLEQEDRDPISQRLREVFRPLHSMVLENAGNSIAGERGSPRFALLDGEQIASVHARIPAIAADRTVGVSYPFAVFNIEITNRCPLRCVMCPRTNDMTRSQGHMDFDLFRRIIDDLVLWNPTWSETVPVRLHGFGESLVHPQFDRFIQYAENQGVRTCLSINPLVLTEDVRSRLLAAAPSLLYVSLDGHDDKTFEQIRGIRKAYDRSKANLLAFLAEKREQGGRSKIVVSMIDFALNRESIEECEAYWAALDGVDEFRSKPFTTWDGNSESVNRLTSISPAGAPRQPQVTCRWPWTAMTILWDGDVVPCCNDFDKRYVLGNLNQESLSAVWNGVRMKSLRAELMNGVMGNSLCRDCQNL
jgi:radical SAM protein with 4Fe4S-binding SPASM domain